MKTLLDFFKKYIYLFSISLLLLVAGFIYFFPDQTYSSDEFGFSFRYPSSLFVSVDPESPNRLMILPQSLRTNKDEPITAIIISVSTDDFVYMTAEEWVNGPNSGYDTSRDGNYNHILVGDQDAVMVNDNWVVVKSPDGKERISIALLVEEEKGAKPLIQEFQEILDTFSFKIQSVSSVQTNDQNSDNSVKDFDLALQLGKYYHDDKINEGLDELQPDIKKYLESPTAFISGNYSGDFLEWFLTGSYSMWDVPEADINRTEHSVLITGAQDSNYAVSISASPYIEGWSIIGGVQDVYVMVLALAGEKKSAMINLVNLKNKNSQSFAVSEHLLQYIWEPEFHDLDGDGISEVWIRYNSVGADGFSQVLDIYQTKDDKLILIKSFAGEGVAKRLNNGQIIVGDATTVSDEGHLYYEKTRLTTYKYSNGQFNIVSDKVVPNILWSNEWEKYF